MKLNAMTIAAIIFMILMLGSTIAYSFIQAVNFGLSGGSKTNLPTTNIIDYELTIDQEQLVLNQGKTIVKYSYSSTCVECLSFANQLESLANQMNGQIFVERLLQNSVQNQTASPATLTFTSSQNSKIYSNPSSSDVVDGLCEVLVNPPVDCAIRKLNTT